MPKVKVILPDDYRGRCLKEFKSTYVSSPIEGDDRTYELRGPLPRTESLAVLMEDCKKMFDCTVAELVAIAVSQILTRVDSKAKNIMFQLDDKTGKFEGYSPKSHILAQAHCDSYRVAGEKTTKSFRDMVQSLKNMGIVPPDADFPNETALENYLKARVNQTEPVE